MSRRRWFDVALTPRPPRLCLVADLPLRLFGGCWLCAVHSLLCALHSLSFVLVGVISTFVYTVCRCKVF